jgi:hypothetical protein
MLMLVVNNCLLFCYLSVRLFVLQKMVQKLRFPARKKNKLAGRLVLDPLMHAFLFTSIPIVTYFQSLQSSSLTMDQLRRQMGQLWQAGGHCAPHCVCPLLLWHTSPLPHLNSPQSFALQYSLLIPFL